MAETALADKEENRTTPAARKVVRSGRLFRRIGVEDMVASWAAMSRALWRRFTSLDGGGSRLVSWNGDLGAGI